ncbi:MAG: hypothetical protein AAB482_00535 [Patescibacteria group bacterium]
MSEESTHFIFDEQRVLISPDLRIIFSFLKEIEKEIESLLNFDKKIESIRNRYLEIIKFVEFLGNKLKEKSIDFNYQLSEDPANIADDLKFHHPLRSEMIVLFANLETLFCLDIAYDNKTFDQGEIISRAMDQKVVKAFIENFCLSKDNDWSIKNPERIQHISPDDLRKLRNALTHFFSVGKGMGVAHDLLNEKSRKLELATKFQAKFLSPEDLFEILRGAAKLMMRKWSRDCIRDMSIKSGEFKERILCVRDVVGSHGVQVVMNDQIKI